MVCNVPSIPRSSVFCSGRTSRLAGCDCPVNCVAVTGGTVSVTATRTGAAVGSQPLFRHRGSAREGRRHIPGLFRSVPSLPVLRQRRLSHGIPGPHYVNLPGSA